jgi:hypothetical protein
VLALALFVLSPAVRASAQETHLLVITGVSGDEEHAKKFHDLAVRFIDAAKKNHGVADGNVVYLAEKPEADPQRIQARSTRESVSKAFADIGARAHPDDEIFVLLIGHGSFDSRGGMFNLPGPDLSADDYAKLLAKWPTQHVVFVNTASASGAFLPAVAAPGRTIVTATKTGGEKNETRFATYFVEAYESEAADRDRNGRVSVLEAFDYAKAKVVKAFEQEGTLLTEHATLDDGSEGKVAATMFLAPAEGRASSNLDLTNPAIRDLVRERDALEQQVAGLKLRKADMDPAQYEQELEKLLLALAEKSRALQQAGKKQ